MNRTRFELACTRQQLTADLVLRVSAAVDTLDAWSWPLDDDAVAAHLGRQLSRGHTSLAFEDLLLAFGAAHGVPAAWGTLERRCRPPVHTALLRVLPVADAEDEEQSLFGSLARGDESPLLTYSGEGPLVGWLVVVATRRAYKVAKQQARVERSGDDVLLERVAEGQKDPALEVFKATHAQTFKQCIQSAFARLTPKERNLLRMHHLDGVQTGELAKVHGVHRATLVRWLADARQSFVSNFRDEFSTSLGTARMDVDSLARVFRSGLDISLPLESVDVPPEP